MHLYLISWKYALGFHVSDEDCDWLVATKKCWNDTSYQQCGYRLLCLSRGWCQYLLTLETVDQKVCCGSQKIFRRCFRSNWICRWNYRSQWRLAEDVARTKNSWIWIMSIFLLDCVLSRARAAIQGTGASIAVATAHSSTAHSTQHKEKRREEERREEKRREEKRRGEKREAVSLHEEYSVLFFCCFQSLVLLQQFIRILFSRIWLLEELNYLFSVTVQFGG